MKELCQNLFSRGNKHVFLHWKFIMLARKWGSVMTDKFAFVEQFVWYVFEGSTHSPAVAKEASVIVFAYMSFLDKMKMFQSVQRKLNSKNRTYAMRKWCVS